MLQVNAAKGVGGTSGELVTGQIGVYGNATVLCTPLPDFLGEGESYLFRPAGQSMGSQST